MAYIGVRSPFNIYYTETGALSSKLELSIDSVLQYTIIKNDGDTFLMDISNLVRDFIQPNMDLGVVSGGNSDRKTVDVSVKFYDGLNATGIQVGLTNSVQHTALDAYSYFSEGNNFTMSNDTILISGTSIWAPEDTGGRLIAISSSALLYFSEYTGSDTSKTMGSNTIEIKRYPCSRYDASKVVFLNKFGVTQELYFFGKKIDSTSFDRETYKSGTLTATGGIKTNAHQIVSYDSQGVSKFVLNTGFVDDVYNEYIKQLMLSEYVWLVDGSTFKPIRPTGSNVTYRTSLNDKLVEYSVEFEEANDLIANVR